MTYCGEHTLVNEKEDGYVAVSMKCRSWICPDCHEDRRRQLIALAHGGKPNRFITLTVSARWGTGRLERAYELSRAWRNIVKALKRKHPGKTLNYLCVLEAQKNGEPHLHIAFRGPWVDQAWLSDQMKARMGAPIVDVRYVNKSSRLAGYIAKYIGKGSVRFGNLKRYWSSKGYDLREPLDGFNKAGAPDAWTIWKFTLKECVGMWSRQGFEVEFDGRICFRSVHATAGDRGPPSYQPQSTFEADVALWDMFMSHGRAHV